MIDRFGIRETFRIFFGTCMVSGLVYYLFYHFVILTRKSKSEAARKHTRNENGVDNDKTDPEVDKIYTISDMVEVTKL